MQVKFGARPQSKKIDENVKTQLNLSGMYNQTNLIDKDLIMILSPNYFMNKRQKGLKTLVQQNELKRELSSPVHSPRSKNRSHHFIVDANKKTLQPSIKSSLNNSKKNSKATSLANLDLQTEDNYDHSSKQKMVIRLN